MSLFVIDASVALAWFFEDEYSPYAEAIANLLLQGQAIAPIIWPLEMANAMLTSMRRGRFPESQALSMIDALRRLPVVLDQDIAPMALAQAALGLGATYRLSAYDASYLELAVRRGLPLATLDARLKQAASATGLPILQAASS